MYGIPSMYAVHPSFIRSFVSYTHFIYTFYAPLGLALFPVCGHPVGSQLHVVYLLNFELPILP
jgi:hypothetical protein